MNLDTKDITYETINCLPMGYYFVGDISIILSKKNHEKFELMYNVADLLFLKGKFKMSCKGTEDGEKIVVHGFFETGEKNSYSNQRNIVFKNTKGKPISTIGCIELVNEKSKQIAEKASEKGYGVIIFSEIDFIPKYFTSQDNFFILEEKISPL